MIDVATHEPGDATTPEISSRDHVIINNFLSDAFYSVSSTLFPDFSSDGCYSRSVALPNKGVMGITNTLLNRATCEVLYSPLWIFTIMIIDFRSNPSF